MSRCNKAGPSRCSLGQRFWLRLGFSGRRFRLGRRFWLLCFGACFGIRRREELWRGLAEPKQREATGGKADDPQAVTPRLWSGLGELLLNTKPLVYTVGADLENID